MLLKYNYATATNYKTLGAGSHGDLNPRHPTHSWCIVLWTEYILFKLQLTERLAEHCPFFDRYRHRPNSLSGAGLRTDADAPSLHISPVVEVEQWEPKLLKCNLYNRSSARRVGQNLKVAKIQSNSLFFVRYTASSSYQIVTRDRDRCVQSDVFSK